MDIARQQELLALARGIVAAAPLYTATTRSGARFGYQQTGAGLGWTSDRQGYRYQATHPVTGRALPAIPEAFLALGREHGLEANALLLNFYGPGGKLGLHQDRDEGCDDPVVSLSLGDDAVFLLGGTTRAIATREVLLHSGDIITLAGPTRFAFHGIARILPGTGPTGLLRKPGRINITLRRLATR